MAKALMVWIGISGGVIVGEWSLGGTHWDRVINIVIFSGVTALAVWYETKETP